MAVNDVDVDRPEYARKTYCRFRSLRVYRERIFDYLIRWIASGVEWGSARINHFLRGDADKEMHDHPFNFRSFILWGWYVEETPHAEGVDCPECGAPAGRRCAVEPYGRPFATPCRERVEIAARPGGPRIQKRYGMFSSNYKKADDMHRLVEVSKGGVWTLMFATPPYREWGFYTARGWLHWKKFESAKQQAHTQGLLWDRWRRKPPK